MKHTRGIDRDLGAIASLDGKGNIFVCFACKGTFKKDWTDEEAVIDADLIGFYLCRDCFESYFPNKVKSE